MIYYFMIYSHLSYCVSTWGGAYKTSLHSLQTHQNLIIGVEAFSDYKAKLKYFLQVSVTIFARHICRYSTHIERMCLLTTPHNQVSKIFYYLLRQYQAKIKRKYFTKRQLLQSLQKYLHFVGVKIWNLIPESIEKTNSLAFESKRKFQLLEN